MFEPSGRPAAPQLVSGLGSPARGQAHKDVPATALKPSVQELQLHRGLWAKQGSGDGLHFGSGGIRLHFVVFYQLYRNGRSRNETGTISLDARTKHLVPTYPGQEQIHLQLGHPAPQTRPDPKPERHRPERVLLGLLLRPPEPALRPEGVRVREDVLVEGHGVVTQVEQRLRETSAGVNVAAGERTGPRRRTATHLLGEEVVSHHDLAVDGDAGVSWHHRIQPGDADNTSLRLHCGSSRELPEPLIQRWIND